jgi:hypothetical protein
MPRRTDPYRDGSAWHSVVDRAGAGTQRRSLTCSPSCSFRLATRDVDEQPHPERLRSQTSAWRFDVVVSVTTPSVELRSRLHGGSWGKRQRTPNLAHDCCRQTEDVLCHVSLAFLRAANGSDAPCFHGSLVQVFDWFGGEPEMQPQRPRPRAPRSSRSSCSWTIRSYD